MTEPENSIDNPYTYKDRYSRVTAIIATYNEDDIIEHSLRELISQGISVYLIDTGSTDETVKKANYFLNQGLIHIEKLPLTEYAHTVLMKRKETLAIELSSDWFISADADEFRESPWTGMNLLRGIQLVDRLGYNAIDFAVLDFVPTHSNLMLGDDPRPAYPYFECSGLYNKLQIRCWKKQEGPVDLSSSGGHEAIFTGRKVFPIRFILRHYPFRGQAHGEKKLFRERRPRYPENERNMGWHVQYDGISEGYNFVRKAEGLNLFDPESVRHYLQTNNREMETLKSDFESIIADKEDHISKLEMTIGTQKATIVNLNIIIKDKDSLITDLNSIIAARDTKILDLENGMRDKDTYIAGLKQTISERDERIARTLSSYSWKITAPLRIGLDVYNKLFEKLMPPTTQRRFPQLHKKNSKKQPNTIFKILLIALSRPIKTARRFSFNKIGVLIRALENESSRQIITNFKKYLAEDGNNQQQVPKIVNSPSIKEKVLQPKKNKFKVTVIVPNYNYEIFLRQRLDSVYKQTYDIYEVILLDDNSSDNSRNILMEYEKRFSNTKCIFNENNSGSVFSQWKKGLAASNGELVWIAESDDFCNENFLENIVPFFEDDAVMLAYSYSVFVNEDKQKAPFAFDYYLSEISTSKWQSSYVETAHREVESALAIKNTIPNVSSVVFRRPNGQFPLFTDQSWLSMEICGDWIFYLNIIKGGKIAYCRESKNFYRIHSHSSSKKTHKMDVYYKEHEQVMCRLVSMYSVDDIVVRRNRDIIKQFYFSNVEYGSENKFQKLYDYPKVLSHKKTQIPNILMVIYSFSTGGGEILPIRLANALSERGAAVTVLNGGFETHNDGIRKMLYPQIPVINYHSQLDLSVLVRDYGIKCIHTHHATMERLIALGGLNKTQNIHHIATIHGMYEMMEDFRNEVKEIIKSVDHWCYLADKNILPFKKYGYYQKNRFSKMNNGMDVPAKKPIDRRELEIDEDAFVACLSSRAIPEKGWREAILAVSRARKISNKNIHLILIGEGVVYEQLKRENIPSFIHLLGFKPNVVDYFASSDICLLPSYFKGESAPLTIIESFMVGKPVVASNIGEVSNMITDATNKRAGIAVELIDGKASEIKFTDAIVRMVTDKEFYQECIETVKNVRNNFIIDNVANRYIEIYKQIVHG